MLESLDNLELAIIGIGVFGLLWLIGNFLLLSHFRNSLKESEWAGIQFEEELVVNRQVVRISKDRSELMVRDLNNNRLILVEMSKVFLADPYSPHQILRQENIQD